MLTLENERERMARELHDTLAQGLAGLVLQLEALEATLELGRTAQALHITGQAKERARTALSEARRAIDDLRAADLSPADSIVREADRFQSATGIPCVLDMPVKLPLSARNGEHVVRCVAEGLTNIMRHARAAHASVTLSIVRDRLHVEIRDDGKGFENTDGLPAGHYGLLGLRERARLAGGDLLITSTVGSGTTLHMTLPLQMEEAA
jgi:NarL family two-component system sensor histidine kinase YdfH